MPNRTGASRGRAGATGRAGRPGCRAPAAGSLRCRRTVPGWERIVTRMLDRICASLVGLRMPRALDALEHTLRRLERGELSALEAMDGLLAEEHVNLETRRIAVALRSPGSVRRRRSRASTTSSDSPSTALASSRSQSSTSSGAPKSSTSLAAKHRQEPPRHRPRRCGGESREGRLPLHPGRVDRGARPRRTRRPADRKASLLLPREPAYRRRDRLPADHPRRRRSLLPSGQRPLPGRCPES